MGKLVPHLQVPRIFLTPTNTQIMAASSTAIVLPPLDLWAEGRLTAIYQAKTQDDFTTAFDDFIAQDVHIFVNGSKISRDDYKQLLERQRFLENSATIKFDGVVRAQLPNTEFTQVHDGKDINTNIFTHGDNCRTLV